jgi:hypothetical protein
MIRDVRGVEIVPTDTVMVTSRGEGARLIDTGIKRPVIRLNRRRVVILDADGQERAVSGSELSVLCRDGADGFEHNKDRSAGQQG